MSSFDFDENFKIKKFDTGGRSAWPLPPYCVFKCREAKPWINPQLFHITPAKDRHAGIMVVGDINDEKCANRFYQQRFPTINEEPEVVYAEFVDVYGLPLPNSKIQLIEYSNNPEKGIDLGDSLQSDDALPGNKNEANKNIFINHGKTTSAKKRKWSLPFGRQKTRSRSLFY